MATKKKHPSPPPGGYVLRDTHGRVRDVPRLNDPDVQESVVAVVRDATRSQASAQKFLRKMGMVTESGRLSRAYGGR